MWTKVRPWETLYLQNNIVFNLLLLRNKDEPYYIARSVIIQRAIDEDINNIRVPNNFGRCPKGLFKYAGAWKGIIVLLYEHSVWNYVLYAYTAVSMFI